MENSCVSPITMRIPMQLALDACLTASKVQDRRAKTRSELPSQHVQRRDLVRDHVHSVRVAEHPGLCADLPLLPPSTSG